jgi:DNA-binding transcriptional ArsR family regulator
VEERLHLTDIAQVKAVLHPLRQRLMDAFGDEPVTPSELARRVGIAASKAHYHVGVLEKAGLVRLVETRSVGSVVEKYYQPAAKNFLMQVRREPKQLSEAMPLIEAELNHLIADLKVALSPDAPDHTCHLAISRLDATPDVRAQVEEYIRGLTDKVDESLMKRPGGRYRLVLAWTPIQEED